jgi:hypothetical protein
MKREKKSRRTKRTTKQTKKIARKNRFKIPQTAQQYFSMSEKDRETWDSVGHFVSRVRDGVRVRKAAKEVGLGPNTAISLSRSALRKQNGRYVAKTTDRLLRVVSILKSKGKQEIATRDSRQASLIGSYWAAVQRYLQTGDDSALLKFRKTRVVDASGKRHLLLTDLAELNKQASAGVLSFESLYGGGSR